MAQACSSVDPPFSAGQMSQLTPLTQSTSPATSTTAVPDSYTPLSPVHPHFHIQVLEWRLLVTCLHRGLGQFSCLYLAKPHLTQEGYLKGAVQAENRTGPHCGGHTPLVSIPAELPEPLASPLGYGFLFPPFGHAPGAPSPGKLAPRSFRPLYLRPTSVTVSVKLRGPFRGGEQLQGRGSQLAFFLEAGVGGDCQGCGPWGSASRGRAWGGSRCHGQVGPVLAGWVCSWAQWWRLGRGSKPPRAPRALTHTRPLSSRCRSR